MGRGGGKASTRAGEGNCGHAVELLSAFTLGTTATDRHTDSSISGGWINGEVRAVMPVSQANIGTQLYSNWNNVNWSQPGGANTKVLPQQSNGPYTFYPVPGVTLVDAGQAIWLFGCGHGANLPMLFKDFNTDSQTQCCIVACPVCSFIMYYITPYEDAIIDIAMTNRFPIVIP